MQYMLDTNICSYILKNRPRTVKAHFDDVPPESMAISAIVMAELTFGVETQPSNERIRRQVADFTSRLQVLPWDDGAARHYGNIRAELRRTGTTVGNMDILIAAHARSLGATLVSNNLREFERIPGLLTENWV